jgi:hypothetical protein
MLNALMPRPRLLSEWNLERDFDLSASNELTSLVTPNESSELIEIQFEFRSGSPRRLAETLPFALAEQLLHFSQSLS